MPLAPEYQALLAQLAETPAPRITDVSPAQGREMYRMARAVNEDLTVVQIDAHADLRPEYHGSTCNHACAVYEASKTTNLIQVGIRSMDVSEKEHMNVRQTYFAHLIHDHLIHAH